MTASSFLVDPESKDRRGCDRAEAREESAGDRGVRPRVLVIDDQPHVRRVVCDLLAALGYEAEGVAEGAEGLARLERHHYAFVLTDLRMPSMTGWEVVQAVRERAPATGVIVMSGSATGRDLERARELGVLVLEKPLPLPDLKAAIDATLGLAARRPLERIGKA